MKRILLFVGALALAGCLDTTGPKPSNPTTETFATSLGVNISSMTKTPNGTYYRDSTIGTGATLNVNNATSVVVDYTGYTANGSQFDTGTDVPIPLNGVIFGFADGIQGMAVGGVRLIVIPSDLGYGSATQGPIPPNSTLIFRIKLKSIS